MKELDSVAAVQSSVIGFFEASVDAAMVCPRHLRKMEALAKACGQAERSPEMAWIAGVVTGSLLRTLE